MSGSTSLNDKAIRLHQLNEAYNAVSRWLASEDAGPALDSLHKEIENISKMIASDVSMFRANGNRWP